MLRIDNLSHRYPGVPSPALQEVSFGVQAGDCLGLLGPNGAGKTTLMSLLAGLQTVQQGSIRLDDKPMSQCSRAELQRISLVPQDFAFYPLLTVRQNMDFFGALFGRAEPAHLDALLARTGLTEHTARQARHLSGGLKRRLNFAIGLINEPRLIFLDEITVGIDPESRQFILDSVAQLGQQGVTVIYTSHYLEEIEQLCNRLVLLHRGRLVHAGRLDRILDAEANRVLAFKPERPLSGADIAELGASVDAQGTVRIQADATEALQILQTLARQGVRVRQFQAGHVSLESFYLDFLRRHASGE